VVIGWLFVIGCWLTLIDKCHTIIRQNKYHFA